jgi:hypothetical protein
MARMWVASSFVSRPRTATIALGCLLATLGCNRGEPLGQVSGRVTYQGQPVTEGIVVFANPTLGVHRASKLGADGRYEVFTNGRPGLPLGSYQVSVAPPVDELVIGPINTPPKPREYANLPKKYRSPATSGLTLEVKSGENPFDVLMMP